MATFDIVSKVDLQTLDNAINTAIKEISTRFDFKDSKTKIELNKKDFIINIETEDDMRARQVVDVIFNRMIKQGIDPLALDSSKEAYPSGALVKQELKIKQGLDKETAKKIVKKIKDLKLKVEASIMDDQIRITAKKIDDLQEVISFCKTADLGVPLQYQNMKS